MPAWPDAGRVAGFLARAGRRLTMLTVLYGTAFGLGAAALAGVAAWLAGWRSLPAVSVMAAAAVTGAAVAYGRAARARAATAQRVEARAPECRNVVVTAAEVIARPGRVSDYVGARVCRDAAAHIERLDLGRLFPATRAALTLAGGAALAAGALWLLGQPAKLWGAGRPVDVEAAAVREVQITITSPEYTRRPPETVHNPSQLNVLEGSRLRVAVTADAADVMLEMVSGPVTLSSPAAGTFVGDVDAAADGFLAIQPASPGGRAGSRTLIGLTITPDRAPGVRVTAPGRDLFLTDGNRAIDVTIEADDDLALASLTLKYTKASGAGENFAFVDGSVPVTLTKTSDRQWTAAAHWSLGSLGLGPGDLIVYRGVATDGRPGGAPVESDAFIIEVTAPGALATDGFAIDDQRDRYALSQQMVILKTERLIAQRAALTPDAFIDEALTLAAMQRSVRAEFVFMMGGEIEDEEIEAAQESELTEGRLVNRGRTDLLIAIRSMSRAAAALTTQEVTIALQHERQALKSLQAAFTRSRYILRTLTTRERIDFERRLTGVLANIARDPRPAARVETPPEQLELRRILTSVEALAGRDRYAPSDTAAVTGAAERLLRLARPSEATRAVAADLTRSAGAIRAGDHTAAGQTLARAAASLSAIARANLPIAPDRAGVAEAGRIRGALADAQRKRGGR